MASAADADTAALIEAVKSRDLSIANPAQEQLIKKGPKAVEAVVEAMAFKRTRRRFLAVTTGIGAAGMPKLVELLGRPELQGAAAEALIQAASASAAAQVPMLAACAQKGEPYKHACGQALVASSFKAGKHVQAISKLLKSADADARVYGAMALGVLGKSASSARPALIEALKDSAPAVRMNAARALGAMRAGAAAPALEQLKNDQDADVRRAAVDALKGIKG